jgi:hyaluronan synthase
MSAILFMTLKTGIETHDPLLIFSNIMPLHSILALYVGWFHYRNPATGKVGDDLVSVIIPVYNQKEMIETVIDAIFRSTYARMEVIAINDGSKDGSTEILNGLAKKYPRLKVVHKKNEGKRKAVASGIFAAKGEYLLLLDSDSVIDQQAITEMIKAFKSDPKIGGAVGHVKVWNADKNPLTRLQDTWYDFSFNVGKACESTFGSVTCCSGCLAAYRRDVVQHFIKYWAGSKVHSSDDRELTSYVIGSRWSKEKMKEMMGVPEPQKLFEEAAKYDDAEDRVMTASTLEKWKTVYVSTAIVYTDVPEKFRGFIKQQERWEKGYIRTNFFVSSFFWHKRSPLMAFVFYTEFMATFTAPLIVLAVFLYAPVLQHQYYYSLSFLLSLFLKGFAIGLDYRFRDPSAKNWKYYPLTVAVTNFVLSWVLFPALYRFKQNKWGTR